MWKLLFGSTINKIISISVIAVVGIVIAYIVFLRFTIADQEKTIFEQAIKIQTLETQNSFLSLANFTLQKDYKEAQENLRKAQAVIANYEIRISNIENQIRDEENQKNRIEREKTGKAQEVLDEDQAQLSCLNRHFGDPDGVCINGVWIETPEVGGK